MFKCVTYGDISKLTIKLANDQDILFFFNSKTKTVYVIPHVLSSEE